MEVGRCFDVAGHAPDAATPTGLQREGRRSPSRACSPLCFYGCLIPPAPLSAPDRHFPLPTANSPPPPPADRHRPDAHCRRLSILSPAVTATGTTRRRPAWCADRWRLRLGKSLWLVTVLGRWEARSATEATVEPSDTKSRNQGATIPDERRASIGQRGWGLRGAPHSWIEEREERDIEEIEPVQHWR